MRREEKMSVTEIKGYKVLAVRLTKEKQEKKELIHHILYKKHENKETKEDSRSIFFCNLPIGASLQVFKKLFQEVAIGSTVESYTPSYLTDSVEDVFLDLARFTSDLDIESSVDEVSSKLPKNCGIVTFIDKSAFQLAISKLKALGSKVVDWPSQLFGSAYFLKKYQSQILDVNELSEDVTQALNNFDQAEQESMESFQNQRKLVDEDGFTLVVGPQRKTKAGILGQQHAANLKAESEKAKAKMKKKEKEDFYRFQLRQRKKEEMNDLLRKFKADQEKIQSMKEKKRFRPY